MPKPSITVKNETDPRGAVHFTKIFCKFVSDDGFNDDQSRNTDVAPGGQDTLWGVHDDCCRSYIAVVTARYPNGETQELPGSKTVDQNYCGGELIYHITSNLKAEGEKPELILTVEEAK